MDNVAPAIPGFRSLSQAGIQLGSEGGGASLTESQEVAGRPAELTPTDTASKVRRAQSVAVQPREPGTKRPLPHQQQPQQINQQGAIPNGLYVGELPSLQFSCPSCGVVLTITEPSAYNGKPGPCPHCSAVVLPPRVISPFAMASTRQPVQPNEEEAPRRYSGFSL